MQNQIQDLSSTAARLHSGRLLRLPLFRATVTTHPGDRSHAPRLVSLEGIDGAGKSTLVSLVEAELNGRGVDAHFTREETATFLGDAVRQAVSEGMDPLAIVHLFLADRVQHLRDLEGPFGAGRLVVTDRYHDSTRAYQGVALEERFGAAAPFEAWLAEVCRDWLVVPVRTYLLDIDPEIAMTRLGSREEKGGYEKLEFLHKVRRRYLELAQEEPERWCVLDAGKKPTELAHQVVDDLEQQGLVAKPATSRGNRDP